MRDYDINKVRQICRKEDFTSINRAIESIKFHQDCVRLHNEILGYALEDLFREMQKEPKYKPTKLMVLK